MKKKTLTTIILIVALAMVAAVTVYAVANYGTKDDPLVTSSYLQDVVQPRMEDAYRSTLDGQVREMEDQFADQVAAAGGSYVLVALESGQTLTGRAGTEILMRTGTAAVTPSAAIDLTTGETAAVGGKAHGKPPVPRAGGRRRDSGVCRHHRHGARRLQRRLTRF